MKGLCVEELLFVLFRHLIGLEPINYCFEGNCFTNSAKDVNYL